MEEPVEGSAALSCKLSRLCLNTVGYFVCFCRIKVRSQKPVGRNRKLFCRQLHPGIAHRWSLP